jgi:flagellar hook-associated protein 1 FlgK
MVSTFHGLEVAKRALNTQQAALYTTTHNISNANTEGYTRQRVNFEQVSTLTGARNADGINANIGSGVQSGSIERIRDQFLDVQFRKENGKSGYYEQRAQAMSQMETIMNEPSEQGLSHTMNQFWDSLQDLAINPEDSGARSVVSQRAQAVADTFNYASTSLEAVRADLKSQIDVTTTEFNSIVTQINNVNQQIGGVEPHGHVPNDLYDERDRLIDRLSAIADVRVSYQKSSGQPSDIAMGKATITLNGVGKDITLVDGATYQQKNMSIVYDTDNNIESYHFDEPGGLPADRQTVAAAAFKSTGELSGLMEMSGFIVGVDEVAGYYNKMLDNLDQMAKAFMDEFNNIHKGGTDLNGAEGLDFFTWDETDGVRLAADFQVNQLIINDPGLIAASLDGNSGDGANAVKLTEAYTNMNVGDLGNKTSIKSFYQSIIGEMGVVTQEANRMVDNSQILRQQVQRNRDSVSSVSLDEEMTNMIKFQHAFNAAARSMTSVDEMLDRIINNMGLVGR